jgi:hypothetical protein
LASLMKCTHCASILHKASTIDTPKRTIDYMKHLVTVTITAAIIITLFIVVRTTLIVVVIITVDGRTFNFPTAECRHLSSECVLLWVRNLIFCALFFRCER